MAKIKIGNKKITVLRTLSLPRDFQLVVGRQDVRKVDAQTGFGVRNRLYDGFYLGVAAVHHTAKAFARYVIMRFRKWLKERCIAVYTTLAETIPGQHDPILIPRLRDVVHLLRFMRFIMAVVMSTILNYLWRHLLRDELGHLFVPTPAPPRGTPRKFVHTVRCKCERCEERKLERDRKRAYTNAIVQSYESGRLVRSDE